MITEIMTVNHIVRMWPEARTVFMRFKIDCEADGISCLDELAWWRGINLNTLLEALRQVEQARLEPVEPQEVANV